MARKGSRYGAPACLTIFLFMCLVATYHLSKRWLERDQDAVRDATRTVAESVRLLLETIAVSRDSDPNLLKRSILGDLLGGGTSTASSSSSGGSVLGSLGSLLGGHGTSSDSGLGDLLGGLNITGALTSAAGGLLSDLAGGLSGPAFYLGMGLGAGSAQGLNLSTADKTIQVMMEVAKANSMANSTGNSIAQNLGTGLSASLLSSVNLSGITSDLATVIGPAALSLAQGIGNGTSAGLQLRNVTTPSTDAANTADIAGLFGFGLADSLTTGVQLPKRSSLLSSLNSPEVAKMIVPAASGLGSGLGQGIPIGLGLQPDSDDSTSTSSSDIVETASQQFAKGLSSSFLANGTLTRLTSQVQTSGSSLLPDTSSINIMYATEGLARGLVQGVGSGIQAVKQASASGNLSLAEDVQQNDTALSSFNDTVGGAAVGFGYGLGDQATIVVSQFLQSNTKSSLIRRGHQASISRVSRLDRRGIDRESFNISAVLTAQDIIAVAQKTVDDLTCEGVGGMVNVFLGLMKSKTIPSSLTQTGSDSTLEMLENLLPKGTVDIKSAGNQYDIDLQKFTNIHINNISIITFAVLLALHIIFMFIAFLVVLPLIAGLLSARTICLLAGRPERLQKSQKWSEISMYYVFLPLTIIALGFGIGVSSDRQFRTAHSILGLFAFLFAIAATVFFYLFSRRPTIFNKSISFRKMNFSLTPAVVFQIILAVLLNFSLLVIILGWSDVTTISLCITSVVPFSAALAFGIGSSSSVNAAVILQSLAVWLQWRSRSGVRETHEVEKGRPGLNISMPQPPTEQRLLPHGKMTRNAPGQEEEEEDGGKI